MQHDHEISRRHFLATSLLTGLTGLAVVGIADALLPASASAQIAPGKDAAAPTTPDVLTPANPADVHLGGHIGERIDCCLQARVMAQDVDKLIQPFRDKRESGDGDWRSEYWGKWFTSAVLACAYQPTPANRAVIDQAVKGLIATAALDGYIGTHDATHRLTGWDVWGDKYVLLGLIAAFDLTGDATYLDAARRHADALLSVVGPGKANIAELGYAAWKGLPPSSVLEPMVLLYRRTGESRYLDFAKYIVADWSVPNRLSPSGMHLIEDALADKPVAQYNASKAYEMTSCFEGLCELYRCTGNPTYLKAVSAYGENIARTELFIVGSGSSNEVWFGGTAAQTKANPDPMETCVTATWMKYSYQLLRLTGDSRWADRLETSLYNALLGALKPDGTWWGYYIPTQGVKSPSYIQHADVGLSCCVVNGPRGLMLTPQWAVMHDHEGPVVNLYNPGSATVKLASGASVRIDQETDYPVGNTVKLTVHPDRNRATFPLKLRIPAWSAQSKLTVNGKDAGIPLTPGTYATVARRWGSADTLELTLDLHGKVVADPGGSDQIAVTRGPIVLAWDRRLPTPDAVNTLHLAHAASGDIDLTPIPVPTGTDVWMTFTAPTQTGNTPITLCDYASAGNTWNRDSTFKVWLQQPLQLPAHSPLTGANWIWFGGEHGVPSAKYAPALEFPEGKRYFRRSFAVPADLNAATLSLTADDAFVVYVNGQQVAQGDHWENVTTVDLRPHLTPGSPNVIAVMATNSSASPAGLIARLDLTGAGNATHFVSDTGWKSTDTAPANWQGVAYDDSGWQSAQVVAALGSAPWGALE